MHVPPSLPDPARPADLALRARTAFRWRRPGAASPRRPLARLFPGARALARAGALGAALALAPACSSVNVFALQDDVSLGQEAYQEILKSEQVLTSGPEVTLVNRVTERLVEAAGLVDPEIAAAFSGNWEVRVIAAPDTINAFCLPGGKMAVYTGILPVAEDDAGLAVVMAHEIAHATHRHGTEALTRQLGVQVVIELAAGEGTAELWSQATNLLLGLPMSRRAELEADRKGLTYMARAGYDPRRAVTFWRKMAEMGGDKPPELLSTHPSDETRIAQIEELLPEALEIYHQATGAQGSPSP